MRLYLTLISLSVDGEGRLQTASVRRLRRVRSLVCLLSLIYIHAITMLVPTPEVDYYLALLPEKAFNTAAKEPLS